MAGNGDTPDPTERRIIRREYRDIMHETKEKKEELLAPETGTEKLNDYLDKTNRIFERVKMPREAALDSQLIATFAQMGKQQAQKLQTEFITFNPVEFAEKLMTHLDVQRLNQSNIGPLVTPDKWTQLGRKVSSHFKRAPVLNFMYGAFERGPPVERVRVERRARDKDTATKNAVVPKQVLDMKDQEKREATTEEVEHILAFLKLYYRKWKKQPICFFEFVIDPKSFGKTIENIFYTSFLVRDGHVRIFLDDDKLPVIEPLLSEEEGGDPAANNNNGADNTERSQIVFAMTQTEWKEIVDTFSIQNALIPPKKQRT